MESLAITYRIGTPTRNFAILIFAMLLSGCVRLDFDLRGAATKSNPSLTPLPTPTPSPVVLPAWSGVKYSSTSIYGDGGAIDAQGNIYHAAVTLPPTPALSIVKYNAAGTQLWQTSTTFVSSTAPMAMQVAIDSTGNVYASGGRTAPSGWYTGILMKVDPDGNILWEREYSASVGSVMILDMALTASNEIIAVGYANGDFNGQSIPSIDFGIIMKVAADGTTTWTQLRVEGTGTRVANASVALNPAGEILVVGVTDVGLSGNSMTGSEDGFISKYSSAGSHIWTRQMGALKSATPESTIFREVSVNNSGAIAVAGFTRGDFNGHTSSGPVANDLIVLKLDGSGNIVWSDQIGSPSGTITLNEIAIDSASNIYTAGDSTGSFAGATSSGGTNDAFLIKHTSSGNLSWNRMLGHSSGMAMAFGIFFDSTNNVYVTGVTTVDFDNATAQVASYLMKYNPSGVRY